MNKPITLIAALLGIGLTIAPAEAQSVNQRQYNQDRRIEQGVRSGRLTPGETRRVTRQQNSIDRQEDRMRSRNGGRLSRYDRARLQQRENRASRHIYRAKHNGRRY